MGAGAGILVSELHRAGLLNGKRIAVFEPERKAEIIVGAAFQVG